MRASTASTIYVEREDILEQLKSAIASTSATGASHCKSLTSGENNDRKGHSVAR